MSIQASNPPDPDGRSTYLGEVVRTRREAAGITLRDVARRAGCSVGYLSQVENGRKKPSRTLMGRLEAALGLEHDDLRLIAHSIEAPARARRDAAMRNREQAAARQLAELLRSAGGNAAALDEAYRTGRLGRLIEEVAPSPAPAEAAPAQGGVPGRAEHSVASRERRDGTAAGEEAGAPGGRGKARLDGGTPLHLLVPFALPVEVPVINSVAAGYPTEFTDLGYPARVADAYVRQPDIHDPDAFAARVVGDSMEPDYREGDIVVFSPAKVVANGMDCFVRIEPDSESTFKRVYFEDPGAGSGGTGGPAGAADAAETGTRIRLQPLNPRYAPRVLPREQVAGLYAAVSVTRMLAFAAPAAPGTPGANTQRTRRRGAQESPG